MTVLHALRAITKSDLRLSSSIPQLTLAISIILAVFLSHRFMDRSRKYLLKYCKTDAYPKIRRRTVRFGAKILCKQFFCFIVCI